MRTVLSQQRLLNEFQHGFPLVAEPFADMATQIGVTVQSLLAQLRTFQQQHIISRVGPVFRPNTIGVSTLAAMSVPEAGLEKVAAMISRYPQVNHNYEREHAYNLWFVLNDSDSASLEHTLACMSRQTGHPILSLPLVKAYHIDLGFDLETGTKKKQTGPCQHAHTPHTALPEDYKPLIKATQKGLPLTERPYLAIAKKLKRTEQSVIAQLATLLQEGIIKRMGVIVQHRKLGFLANGMVVFDIPDTMVDAIAYELSAEPRISLCYQRPRREPHWPYNLFCMIHGKSRQEVLEHVTDLHHRHNLSEIPQDILFSKKCFKQRGATYRYG